MASFNTGFSSSGSRSVARQFSPRSIGFIALTTFVTVLAMTASFMLSFSAQVAIAELMHLSGWMVWLLPAGVDSFILTSALALVVIRDREGTQAPGARVPWFRSAQGRQWALMWGWTLASIGLNVWHGFEVSKDAGLPVQIGLAVVSTLFPLGVLTATDGLLRILVAETTDSAELAAAKTRLANSGPAVAAQPAAARGRSTTDRDLDLQIQAEYALADGPLPTIKSLATKFSVSAARVKAGRDAATA
ncbi:DUF2637 domain-containing protein [Cryobacterium sp. TMT1-66-1]|nr:DUF2637 domain-containing protein [Cryobacterium sp. TMT1-66-1]